MSKKPGPPKTMKTIGIGLTFELYDQMVAEAKRKSRTHAAVIRLALKAYLPSAKEEIKRR